MPEQQTIDTEPRPLLTITHTSQDGTMLEGSEKGDGAWDAIKAAQDAYRIRGWRYMRSIRAIAVSHSRDNPPQLRMIARTAEVLRDAGFDVELVVDGAPRPMEESEGARAERMDDRADALLAKADRKGAEADARWEAGQAIAERFTGGQPILRGHHSERGHRRDLQRMDGHQRASIALGEEAVRAADAAASAQRHMDLREAPGRVYRRIRTQEAERRKVGRALEPCKTSGVKLKETSAGRTLTCPTCYRERTVGDDATFPEHGAAAGLYREEMEARAAHLDERIRYWNSILDEHRAAGRWNPVDSTTVKKGYWVKSWAGWCEVVRVNKVSITVIDTSWNTADGTDRSFHRKITIDDVKEVRETRPGTPAPAEVVDLDAAVKA